MNNVVSVSVPSNALGVAILLGAAKVLENHLANTPQEGVRITGGTVAVSETAPAVTPAADTKGKRGRKAAAPAVKAEVDLDIGNEAEDDPLSDLGLGEEEEVAVNYTAEDVANAFKKFIVIPGDKAKSAENREKAIKILAKFGAKSVPELPKEKYADVIKALS
jgi:hypothetical protein